MRDDLLHAQASIDWAVAQLPAFQKRLSAWVDENIEVVIEDSKSETADDIVVAVEKASLPLSFLVETGAYINAIRSSLDILATSLAYRYGVPKPDKCYFPFAGSQ